MIPQIIHYCWFGKKEKPTNIQKCIATWKRNLPDYQFVEWNEQNFDVNMFSYAVEAYRNGKYAFVSDIARIYALFRYGGIYLDTDVEVYQSFDLILHHRCVFGFEYKNWIATSFMAAEAKHPLMEKFLAEYNGIRFCYSDGLDMSTNVQKLTLLLCRMGLHRDNSYQELIDGIVVYPKEYFSPYDYGNCVLEKTKNSICVHHFYVSWLPRREKIKKGVKKIIVSIIGKKQLVAMRNAIKHEREVE